MTISQRPAYLFDLDGTVLDTASDIAAAMKKTLQALGRSDSEQVDQNYYLYGNSSELLAKLLNLPMNSEAFLEIQQQFFQYYIDDIARYTDYFPEIEQLIAKLQQQNIPWGIVTNKPQQLTQPLLKHFPLLQQADVCLYGDSLPNPKPAPDLLHLASQIINVSTNHCFYVGDTITDCLAAQSANMKSVIVTYGYHNRNDDPYTWNAQHYFETGASLYAWAMTQIY